MTITPTEIVKEVHDARFEAQLIKIIPNILPPPLGKRHLS
jgi:hypothetical protein